MRSVQRETVREEPYQRLSHEGDVPLAPGSTGYHTPQKRCRPRCCNACCCAYILLVFLLVFGSLAIVIYMCFPEKPTYETVYLQLYQASSFDYDGKLYVNGSGQLIVQAKNHARVATYINSLKLDACFYDWINILTHVGKVEVVETPKYLRPQDRVNVTMSVVVPAMSESVYYNLVQTELTPANNYTLQLGLQGFAKLHVKALGAIGTAFVNCFLNLNGTSLASKPPLLDALTPQARLNAVLSNVTHRMVTLPVIYQNCNYSTTSIQFGQY